MVRLLLLALLAAQAIQSVPPGQKTPDPIRVSSREAQEHLLTKEEPLRVATNLPSFLGIETTVVVDAEGAVISATALPSREPYIRFPPGTAAQAEAMIRGLRFKPFQRQGRPVEATFYWQAALLPLEIRPHSHVQFPRVKDWKSVRIVLERTACFGRCPAYRVEVRGDGSVLYRGDGHVAFTGTHRGSVPQANVIELVRQFEQADYFSLRDSYYYGVSDFSTQITSIEIDGRRKRVTDYAGSEMGMPLSVSRLENAIDRLSGSERWTRGNSETAAALEAEHWNFKSKEGAAALMKAIHFGNADVVRDLLRAGVPVKGMPGVEHPDAEDIFPLATAAGEGHIAMLGPLLEAGAGSSPKALAYAVIDAAESGNLEALRLLIANGGSVASRDSAGRTLLMAAAASGSPAMVGEVLRHQPDVNVAAHREPPACAPGEKQPADGPNSYVCPDWEENDGRTALMETFQDGRSGGEEDYEEGIDRAEVVRLLLEAGADVNARDHGGTTALMLCRNSAEIALMLIKAGADPNARNRKGWTALTDADDEVRAVLLKHGATPNAGEHETAVKE